MLQWLYDLLRDRRENKRNREIDSHHIFLSFFYGLPYLKRVQQLPQYSNDVDSYIRRKARDDLPAVQFEGRVNEDSPLKDRLEITGVMGYNKGLFEICYQNQSREDLEILVNEAKTKGIHAYGSCKSLDPGEKADDVYVLIHFHSHPFGDEFCTDDLRDAKWMLRKYPGKKQYFLLYVPFEDRVDWYEEEK